MSENVDGAGFKLKTNKDPVDAPSENKVPNNMDMTLYLVSALEMSTHKEGWLPAFPVIIFQPAG